MLDWIYWSFWGKWWEFFNSSFEQFTEFHDIYDQKKVLHLTIGISIFSYAGIFVCQAFNGRLFHGFGSLSEKCWSKIQGYPAFYWRILKLFCVGRKPHNLFSNYSNDFTENFDRKSEDIDTLLFFDRFWGSFVLEKTP